MKHFGDITALSGYTAPPVDVITGGSPCQDLSIAGKREGLAGARSGLFMEQIRVIKELRDADRKRGRTGVLIRPRFMVWENVPGAFSSNGGNDFKAVLEETIRVAEPDAPDLPLPPKGKWPLADAWYGDGWSVAYQVLDAQFWGVPQRRRRIALVADFGGHAAPEILFVRQGVQGDIDESGAAREEAAGSAGGGADRTICLQGNGIDRGENSGCEGKGFTEDVCYTVNTRDRHAILAYPQVANTLAARADGSPQPDKGNGANIVVCGAFSPGQGEKARGIGYEEERSQTLKGEVNGNNPPAVVYDARGNGDGKTVCIITGDHENRVTDYTALCVGNGQTNNISMAEQANTLDTMHDQQAVLVAAVDCRNGTENPNINGTLQAKSTEGMSLNLQNVCRQAGIVRRLTPLECERLQGYPDGWTDIGEWTDSKGKQHKEADSPRYKALGNSIALPPWAWVLKRIAACYERPATLGSLFDGIGGFPLIWERLNGKGAALWASEIEEFPMAVTKARFGEATLQRERGRS